MSRLQLLILSVVLVICSLFFWLGYKTDTKQTTKTPAMEGVREFDVEVYRSEALSKISSTLAKQLSDNGNDEATIEKAARLWDSLGYKVLAAEKYAQLAQLKPSEAGWYKAASAYYFIASATQDSAMLFYTAKKAGANFEKVLTLNPDNADAKNALAIIHIQVYQDVMKGVGLLKEVVAKDSNNVQALFTLGVLSIQSGQMDKAQQRFEKLVKLEPFNPEYYYYLGECMAKSGNKTEAIKTYETCRSLIKDQEAKKEIESIIKQLKNS